MISDREQFLQIQGGPSNAPETGEGTLLSRMSVWCTLPENADPCTFPVLYNLHRHQLHSSQPQASAQVATDQAWPPDSLTTLGPPGT